MNIFKCICFGLLSVLSFHAVPLLCILVSYSSASLLGEKNILLTMDYGIGPARLLSSLPCYFKAVGWWLLFSVAGQLFSSIALLHTSKENHLLSKMQLSLSFSDIIFPSLPILPLKLCWVLYLLPAVNQLKAE